MSERMVQYEAYSLTEEGEIRSIHKKGMIKIDLEYPLLGRTLGEAIKEIGEEFGFSLTMEQWQEVEQENEIEVECGKKADKLRIDILKVV